MKDYYHDNVIVPISKGYVKEGYFKLKEQYPERIKELEAELNSNFKPNIMDKYRKTIITGLKKIGYWRE